MEFDPFDPLASRVKLALARRVPVPSGNGDVAHAQDAGGVARSLLFGRGRQKRDMPTEYEMRVPHAANDLEIVTSFSYRLAKATDHFADVNMTVHALCENAWWQRARLFHNYFRCNLLAHDVAVHFVSMYDSAREQQTRSYAVAVKKAYKQTQDFRTCVKRIYSSDSQSNSNRVEHVVTLRTVQETSCAGFGLSPRDVNARQGKEEWYSQAMRDYMQELSHTHATSNTDTYIGTGDVVEVVEIIPVRWQSGTLSCLHTTHTYLVHESNRTAWTLLGRLTGTAKYRFEQLPSEFVTATSLWLNVAPDFLPPQRRGHSLLIARHNAAIATKVLPHWTQLQLEVLHALDSILGLQLGDSGEVERALTPFRLPPSASPGEEPDRRMHESIAQQIVMYISLPIYADRAMTTVLLQHNVRLVFDKDAARQNKALLTIYLPLYDMTMDASLDLNSWTLTLKFELTSNSDPSKTVSMKAGVMGTLHDGGHYLTFDNVMPTLIARDVAIGEPVFVCQYPFRDDTENEPTTEHIMKTVSKTDFETLTCQVEAWMPTNAQNCAATEFYEYEEHTRRVAANSAEYFPATKRKVYANPSLYRHRLPNIPPWTHTQLCDTALGIILHPHAEISTQMSDVDLLYT